MHIVGLTGGIATGKSTVSQLMRRSVPIVDADLIARQVVEPGTTSYFSIIDTFGLGILTRDSRIDRATLGQIIFSNPEKRRVLNRIVHPAIRLEMLSQTLWHILRCERTIVLDTPLLFESGLHRWVTLTVVVYCPEKEQKQRLMRRDGFNPVEAQDRINSQLPIEQKRILANRIIDNSGALQDTRDQVAHFLQEYESQSLLLHYTLYMVFFWPALMCYIAIRLAIALDYWRRVGVLWKRKVPEPYSTFVFSSLGDIAPAE